MSQLCLVLMTLFLIVNISACNNSYTKPDNKNYSEGDELGYITEDGAFTKEKQKVGFYRKLVKKNTDNTYSIKYIPMDMSSGEGMIAIVNSLYPPHSGVYIESFENDNIKRESHYKNDKLNGLSTVWLRGIKSTTTYYKNDVKDGSEIQWDPQGNKVFETIYQSGTPMKTILWSSSEIKLIQNDNNKRIRYYPSGKKRSEATLINGKIDGVFIEYYESGSVAKKENYINDKREGLSETWYENGQKATEMIFYKGYENGLQKAWYETGELRVEKKMINGLLFQYKEYYQNGHPKLEKNYQYGILDGKSTEWDETGKIIKEVMHK